MVGRTNLAVADGQTVAADLLPTARSLDGGRASPARRSPIAASIARGVGLLMNIATVPIIYSLLLPFVLLDAWVMGYQWICFPIYRIARVRRRAFFVLDRFRLPYLTPIERAHCLYCSYANAVIAFTREVTARTEQYWCPIKHRRTPRGTHRRYRSFVGYGDANAYTIHLPRLRRQLRQRLPPRQARRRR